MGTGHEYDNTVVDMENNEDKVAAIIRQTLSG
jgi:hypothetical protein